VNIRIKRFRHLPGRRLFLSSLALGAAATVAACGSSSSGTAAGSSSSAPASASAAAAVTVSAKSVPGVGTVLVNGQGQTLYMLTSEQGGKITCTTANGCIQVWPETVVASGTTAMAGSGVQSSLLGTVKDASGNLEVTYNKWPLYTFTGDSGAGVAHGQGLSSFGGTWYVLSAAGNPVTTSPAGSSPSSGGGGGY
jgi:predicted lipoprotein with Yx(FWY)xxD motif